MHYESWLIILELLVSNICIPKYRYEVDIGHFCGISASLVS